MNIDEILNEIASHQEVIAHLQNDMIESQKAEKAERDHETGIYNERRKKLFEEKRSLDDMMREKFTALENIHRDKQHEIALQFKSKRIRIDQSIAQRKTRIAILTRSIVKTPTEE
ncbi:MAG: hypothetical protein ACI36Z_00435 [Alloprevotella sp.]